MHFVNGCFSYLGECDLGMVKNRSGVCYKYKGASNQYFKYQEAIDYCEKFGATLPMWTSRDANSVSNFIDGLGG